jgi:hypothetical protein
MSHLIKERDIQAGLSQAWHGLTTLEQVITRENSMPYEVVECPIFYKKPNPAIGESEYIEDEEFKILLANDDWLPVSQPYASSYTPSSIAMFWEIIRKGMGDTPYVIHSAGSVDNRGKIFASLKVSEGFEVAGRKFDDYITILDSFDKSMSLTAKYTNICTVCNNTFMATLGSGQTIGKAKHSQMLELNVSRLTDAIDQFAGTSNLFKAMLQHASEKPCSKDEAKAWSAGIHGRNMDRGSNGLTQKAARIGELFESGKGNVGQTRLDAFQAFTEFETHESSNRKEAGAQAYASTWGASAAAKTIAATRFVEDWDKNVKLGTRLLEDKSAMVLAG